jgi:hypothetical protein
MRAGDRLPWVSCTGQSQLDWIAGAMHLVLSIQPLKSVENAYSCNTLPCREYTSHNPAYTTLLTTRRELDRFFLNSR